MLPTTDIVIIDRYLFTNACELVEYNINRILSALSYNVKNKVNVVVFTKNDSLMLFGVDNATKIIKKTLENVTGMKPQITFVSSNDGSSYLTIASPSLTTTFCALVILSCILTPLASV